MHDNANLQDEQDEFDAAMAGKPPAEREAMFQRAWALFDSKRASSASPAALASPSDGAKPEATG
jgi:hypothetical protein